MEVKDVTTREDTEVKFLAGVKVFDKGAGSEVINAVSFGVDLGWVVSPPAKGVAGIPSTGWAYDITNGIHTITFEDGANALTEAQRELVLSGFGITPPPHSSQDMSVTLTITSTDSAWVNGSSVSNTKTNISYKLKIEVTPVAETATDDSDKKDGVDVGLTPGYKYQNAGQEDEWFALNIKNGFQLKDGWFNSDGDEQNFARLTPTVTGGEGFGEDGAAIGSSFQYFNGKSWVVQVYDGKTPIDIPVQYLDSLQFKAPPNFSGKFSIAVQAVARDYDDDHEGTGAFDEAVSGNAKLENILINPVADDVTLALNGSASGKEDAKIDLSISPSSSDSSETFNVTIKDIPAGAKIFYNGVEQSLQFDSGTGKYFVVLEDFKPDASKGGVQLMPPANSNQDFSLKVSAESVDSLTLDGTPYVVKSVAKELDIKVSVKGVADGAVVTATPQTYVEAALDDKSVQVKLGDLVSVALGDTDGSETLTVKVTGLPEGFSLDAGTLLVSGSGTGRVWLLTQEQFDKALIKVPANYSGNVEFTVAGVATENDGDANTGAPVKVGFTVTPSVEAEASTAGTVEEDKITSLGFGISYKGGDTDETLGRVWIDKSDAVSAKFTLYLDGKTLAQAMTDGDITEVTKGGNVYYQLSAEQAGRLGALGAAHLDGDLGSFDYLYEVTDSHYDLISSGASHTLEKGGSFNIKATAVTDKVIVGVEDITVEGTDFTGSDIALSAAGKVTVNLDIRSEDMDGSEHVVRVLIDGVPNGVTVTGAVQTAAGSWILIFDGADAKKIAGSGLGLPVEFVVGLDAGKLTGHQITMTVQAQDNGDKGANTAIESGSVNWTLSTTFDQNSGDAPPEIGKWKRDPSFNATEDVISKLSDIMDAEVTIKDGSKTNVLTVTLENIPSGVVIDGMVATQVPDGTGGTRTVWTASVTVAPGEDGQAKLNALLDSITVKTPKNSNENNNPGGLDFDAKLSASIAGGQSNVTKADVVVPVVPVTDPAQITVATKDITEGTPSIEVKVTVGSGDGAFGEIVGGKLYLQIDPNSTDALEGGTLTHNGTKLVLMDIEGVPGVPDGKYYVVDVGTSGSTTVDMIYTPRVSTIGNVTFVAYAQSKEQPNAGIPGSDTVTETISSSGTANVVLTNNGVTVISNDVSGQEVSGVPSATVPAGTKDGAIELTGTGGLSVVLQDTDGSESIHSIMLTDVPVGFLVYVGDGVNPPKLASNAGGDGVTNSWLLGEGELPKYVAVLPPQNWSGTLSGLELVVESGEDDLPARTDIFKDLGSVTVIPKADGLTLDTTVAFGKENSIIALNLNASMNDPVHVGIGDNSTETTTLKITGLGPHASFYVNGVELAASKVSYENGSYTITGLTQNQLDQLGFKQAMDSLIDQNVDKAGIQLKVEAWTVEDGNSSKPSDIEQGEITVKMSSQLATFGNDTLLWTGKAINGSDGVDTVQLRSGENLIGSDLAAQLKNVEVLDLSVHGANSITGLSAADVFAITGATATNHVLTIKGTADDLLQLSSGWKAGSVAGTYTSTHEGHTVTVVVNGVTVNNGSTGRASSFSVPSWDDLFSSESGSISLDNVLPASSASTTTTLAPVAAHAFAADSSALYAPLPQTALDDELQHLSMAHF